MRMFNMFAVMTSIPLSIPHSPTCRGTTSLPRHSPPHARWSVQSRAHSSRRMADRSVRGITIPGESKVILSCSDLSACRNMPELLLGLLLGLAPEVCTEATTRTLHREGVLTGHLLPFTTPLLACLWRPWSQAPKVRVPKSIQV